MAFIDQLSIALAVQFRRPMWLPSLLGAGTTLLLGYGVESLYHMLVFETWFPALAWKTYDLTQDDQRIFSSLFFFIVMPFLALAVSELLLGAFRGPLDAALGLQPPSRRVPWIDRIELALAGLAAPAFVLALLPLWNWYAGYYVEMVVAALGIGLLQGYAAARWRMEPAAARALVLGHFWLFCLLALVVMGFGLMTGVNLLLPGISLALFTLIVERLCQTRPAGTDKPATNAAAAPALASVGLRPADPA